MIIGVDARPLSRPNTGIGRYTEEMLREMVNLGHNWILFSSSTIPDAYKDLPNVTVVSNTHSPDSPASLLYSLYIFRRWALKFKIDVFWSPRHHLPPFLPNRIKSVLTIHDVIWKRYPKTMRPINLLSERLLMPHAVNRADAIVCVSRFTRDDVVRFWPRAESKCNVILSGGLRDTTTHESSKHATSPYFLFVGTPEPRKNLHNLIEAFHRFKISEESPFDLAIVGGNGWGAINLQDMINERDLNNSVKLFGEVSDETLATLYKDAYCLVMPSIHEGCGLPVIEAIQFGTPVITSINSAPAEMAGEACITCEPENVESIVYAMRALGTRVTLRNELSAKAIKRGKLFFWRKAALEMVALMEKVHSDAGDSSTDLNGEKSLN